MVHDRISPHSSSRGEHTPTLVVLHSDAAPSVAATINWLLHPDSKVSYHYSIGRSGVVYRHVDEELKAWHAGKSEFRGESVRGSVNAFSIGVNLSNRQNGKEPFPEDQLDIAALLVADICKRHRIPLLRICTHAECATPKGRKRDPYPAGAFDMMDFQYRIQSVM